MRLRVQVSLLNLPRPVYTSGRMHSHSPSFKLLLLETSPLELQMFSHQIKDLNKHQRMLITGCALLFNKKPKAS